MMHLCLSRPVFEIPTIRDSRDGRDSHEIDGRPSDTGPDLKTSILQRGESKFEDPSVGHN